MSPRQVSLHGPALGASGDVLAYGHWGRPLLCLPSEAGSAGDAESYGIVTTIRSLLEAGRVKLHCVDSVDSTSWSEESRSLEDRARRPVRPARLRLRFGARQRPTGTAPTDKEPT
jgi:esterase/lipase superfamily enzyme